MKSRGHNYFRFLPIIGILIFVMLYLVAASLYPGGSSAFPEKDGFDWINSYWCNLTESYAINGKVNTARPYALSGVVILCISLTHFFFLFPRYFELKSPWDTIVAFSGLLACIFALLIHTELHDIMAIMASVFGSFTVIALFFGLRKSGWYHFIWTGVVCLILVAGNGYVYFSRNYAELLPLIQKITFAIVLLWFLSLNFTFRPNSE